VHLYDFCAIRYVELAAVVKVLIGSPKMSRNEQVYAHKNEVKLEVTFPKHLRGRCAGCSYAPILRFSLWRKMAPQ